MSKSWGVRIVRCIQAVFLTAIVICGSINICYAVKSVMVRDKTPAVFGVSKFLVHSGSMEPTLRVGEFVVCLEKSSYDVGDVVLIRKEEAGRVTHIVHRIVARGNEPDTFVTKGDGNGAEDREPATLSEIKGAMVYHSWALGLVTGFVQTIPGRILLFVSLLTIWLVLDMWKNLLNREEKEAVDNE